jgi:hypothetical protein
MTTRGAWFTMAVAAAGLALGCATAPKPAPAPAKPPRPAIVGELEPAAILAIGPAWAAGEAGYEPATGPVEFLAGSDAPLEIEVVFGSWCSDSEEHVPHYLKILARATAARERLGRGPLPIHTHFVAVPRKKEGETRFAAGDGVERVPTFIVKAAGRELGRIVEKPQGLLEEDLASLVAAAG